MWLKSVQDEFRIGALSTDSHAFLHGMPTLVPGNTIEGKCKCTSKWCRSRAIAMTKLDPPPSADKRYELCKETLDKECEECKSERKKEDLLQNPNRIRDSSQRNSKWLLLFFPTMTSNMMSINCARTNMQRNAT